MIESTNRQSALEWSVALIAAIDCLAVAFLFSLNQSTLPGNSFSNLWPIPGLYFLELVALAVLALVSVSIHNTSQSLFWHSFPWFAAGIMLAFVVLGAWSIGSFLIPALLAFLLKGLLVDLRVFQNGSLNYITYLLVSVILLALAILGAWSIGSGLIILVLLAVIILLLLVEVKLAKDMAWRHLGLFLLAGFGQTLLMYLLVLPHL